MKRYVLVSPSACRQVLGSWWLSCDLQCFGTDCVRMYLRHAGTGQFGSRGGHPESCGKCLPCGAIKPVVCWFPGCHICDIVGKETVVTPVLFHYQVLKKIAKFIQEQNEKIYAPQGLLLTDPIERGLRVVSFCGFWHCLLPCAPRLSQ